MVYLSNKRILLVSPEPWDHIFVSKHHYAINLAKVENTVYFLGPPTEKNWTIINTEFEGVFVIKYPGFISGLRFLPGFLRKYEILKVWKKLEQLTNCSFDIIWSFDNSVFFDFNFLPRNVKKISHIVDLNQDFETRRAASSADICLCTTSHIYERLKKWTNRIQKVNHGFTPYEKVSKVLKLPGNSNLKTIYAGNLAMPFIDWKIIATMVGNHPEVDFIFIGPNGNQLIQTKDQNEAKQMVFVAKNCFHVGAVPSNHLRSMLLQADILLVSYQEKYHKDQASPHKIMEYLGSGRMIVSTFTAEYLELVDQGLFLMSRRNNEVPHLFKSALRSLEHWNGVEQINTRIRYALDNTYQKHIVKIDSAL